MIMSYPKKEKVSSSLWRDDSDMNRGNRNIWDRHLVVLYPSMDLSYSWSQKQEYPPFLNILFGSILFIHEGYCQIFLIKLIRISVSSVKHIKVVNW